MQANKCGFINFERFIGKHFNIILYVAISAAALSISGCSTNKMDASVSEVIVIDDSLYLEIEESDTLLLCWDPPQHQKDTIEYYEVFCRTEKDSVWTMLKTGIAASKTPMVLVRRTELTPHDSVFFWAVRGVSISGEKTDFHFCSDSTALPAGGWRLLWKSD